VSSAADRAVEKLSQESHSRIGVTTAGDVRAAGGTIEPDPAPDNPYHATVSGFSRDTEELQSNDPRSGLGR
jgi:hypothetical protein